MPNYQRGGNRRGGSTQGGASRYAANGQQARGSMPAYSNQGQASGQWGGQVGNQNRGYMPNQAYAQPYGQVNNQVPSMGMPQYGQVNNQISNAGMPQYGQANNQMPNMGASQYGQVNNQMSNAGMPQYGQFSMQPAVQHHGVIDYNVTTLLDYQSEVAPHGHEGLRLTIIEGDQKQQEVDLASFNKDRVTFGSAQDNDIVIDSASGIVSRHHGSIAVRGPYGTLIDEGSTNGLLVNGARQVSCSVQPGDVITIGKPGGGATITMLLSYDDARWNAISLASVSQFSIGRSDNNDLVFHIPSVSSNHAVLQRGANGQWFITDKNSFNGTYVDGVRIRTSTPLKEGCSIYISSVPMVFQHDTLLFNKVRDGVDLVASHLFMERKQHGKKRLTSQDVSLHIQPGEFVAIVGGSGSGKSTLLNMLNGTDPATQGKVYLNGADLYGNYVTMKNSIGYVPQQDIVYDNLRVVEALRYSAELRMPPDTSKEDREQRVNEVIEMLELEGERENFIGHLSGGQKKRASIAVELLADPRLLFLDEPTSGLDPGIEGNLMRKLATMAHDGRTIILVTHTTTNLHLCDRVVFMGPGGKMCYEGDPSQALGFFGVEDWPEIYTLIDQNVDEWSRYFDQTRGNVASESPKQAQSKGVEKGKSVPLFKQLGTLTRRYAKLVVNDRARLALLILQAPALAALICMVIGTGCFTIYEDTKSCLFAMACAAFWVGILDAIQEICKEKQIYEREYTGGLSISAYVFSKVIVLGVLCVIQSLLLTVVFCAIAGVPSYAEGTSPIINPALELFVTVLLTSESAMCVGLFVSSLFQNPDRAIAMAPILIMPQILFSGLIFELKGLAEGISLFVNCRWSMEAFGTTANLNALDNKIIGEEVDLSGVQLHNIDVQTPATTVTQDVDTGLGTQSMNINVPANNTTIDTVTVPDGTTQSLTADMYPHEAEDAFMFTFAHLLTDWGILLLFCVVCIAGCCVSLKMKARR